MNKYKEAIKVVDTVLHHMCGEEREDGYLPTMEEMSNSMDLLTDLANKADAFNEFKCSNHEPELEEYRHTQTLEEYKESKVYKYCSDRPLEDVIQAVTNIYEDRFMCASKDLERVKNHLKEWLDLENDEPREPWNRKYMNMVESIYEFKRSKDLYDNFLDSVQWIKNQYEVVKRR